MLNTVEYVTILNMMTPWEIVTALELYEGLGPFTGDEREMLVDMMKLAILMEPRAAGKVVAVAGSALRSDPSGSRVLPSVRAHLDRIGIRYPI